MAWEAGMERLLDAGERQRVARLQAERVAADDIAVRGVEWERLYERIGGRARPADPDGDGRAEL
jgi:hypothetical protein